MEQHKEIEDLKSVVLRSVKLTLLFAIANAMGELKERNKRLMKLILTSQTVDSDICPYQLQQRSLLPLLSLEAVLVAHPSLPTTASEREKDKLVVEQGKIWEFEIVIRGYEENLGEPLQKVEGDVEWEWKEKFDEKAMKRLGECLTLAAFVTKFDVLGLGLGAAPVSKLQPRLPILGGVVIAFS
ncbi:hypothetical protein BDQ17DRAFT_1437626 [Cyathus striatus]|nr:hypothetical protein BDQ17DRAFT_1437626 [Cyathus striatus]